MDPRILSVEPLANYYLKVSLSTGDERYFDCKPYLDRGVFKRLKDVDKFQQVYVAFGTVCWPGDLDIAPETVLDRATATGPAGPAPAPPVAELR